MCRWDCWVKLGPFPCRRATLSAAADSTLASVYKKKIDPFARVNISRACADCLKQRWPMLWLLPGYHVFRMKCMKSWLAQGGSGRRVILLPGASFLHINRKTSLFSYPTSAFRSLISRTKIGISVIIFWARSEIMVSMSRSIPHSLRMLLYWGWRANHSFSLTRVISASQSFSFASVPSFPVCWQNEWRIALVLSSFLIKTLKKKNNL